jgi:hypothetical protein
VLAPDWLFSRDGFHQRLPSQERQRQQTITSSRPASAMKVDGGHEETHASANPGAILAVLHLVVGHLVNDRKQVQFQTRESFEISQA